MSNGFIFTLWCCITTVVLQHHFIATPRIQALEKQLRRAVARNTQLEQVEQIDEPGIRRNTNKDGLMEIELEQQHSIHQGKHGIFVISLLEAGGLLARIRGMERTGVAPVQINRFGGRHCD